MDISNFNGDCSGILNEDAFTPNHAGFFHYTTFENTEKILGLGANYFYASNIERMNDIDERRRYPKDDNKVYSLCFCNHLTENLPLWYLYGGITGKGMRIGFRPVGMKHLIESVKVVYPLGEDGKPLTSVPLHIGQDFEFKCDWIFYTDYSGRNKYRDKTYEISKEEYDSELEKRKFFVKRYPWNYEGEFRLVFAFKESVGKRIAIPFEREVYVKSNWLRIGFAPNYINLDNDGKAADNKDYTEARQKLKKDLRLPFSIMEKSTIKVNYDLLQANSRIIVNDFASLLEHFDPDERKDIIKIVENSLAKAKKKLK